MKTKKRVKRGARELFRACFVDGELADSRAREVARRLGTSHRCGALALLGEFQRLVRLDRDRRTAVIESAVPLGDALRSGIADRLHRAYGASLATSFSENPSLIGGVRIRVGSDVYDGSIRGRLRALEATL
jgi:F-type H+-transporting ATPase subunit delta